MPIALFDLDNTLLDREGAFARWARDFTKSAGLPGDAAAYLVSADEDGLRPRHELFADVQATFGLAATVDDLVERYGYEYPAAYTFPDTSRAALRRLRSAGWKVAVVTNGPRFQERKLEVTGLDDEVDAVCVSAVVGSWKPDPGIFEEAARRCGVGLEGWMVGDSGPADIRGGQRGGAPDHLVPTGSDLGSRRSADPTHWPIRWSRPPGSSSADRRVTDTRAAWRTIGGRGGHQPTSRAVNSEIRVIPTSRSGSRCPSLRSRTHSAVSTWAAPNGQLPWRTAPPGLRW